MTLYAHSLTAAVAFLAGVLVAEGFRVGGEALAFAIHWHEQR